MNDSPSKRGAVFLRPGQGRPYDMGRMNAVYKAALVPGGMTHDFKNATDDKAIILNIGVPGGFEQGMPRVVQHFAKNPPGDA